MRTNTLHAYVQINRLEAMAIAYLLVNFVDFVDNLGQAETELHFEHGYVNGGHPCDDVQHEYRGQINARIEVSKHDLSPQIVD